MSFRQAITPPISLHYLLRVSPASQKEAPPRAQLVLELSRISLHLRLPSRVTCKKCQCKHHTALHDKNIQGNETHYPNQFHRTISHHSNNHTRPVSEQKYELKLHYCHCPGVSEFNNKFVSTYAFLDMGSNCSYFQKNIAEQFHVPFHQK